MPEQPPSSDPPALTSAQEARVAEALAHARATEPMPDHVRARLDGVLGDLVRERQTAAMPGTPGSAMGPVPPGSQGAGRGQVPDNPSGATVVPFRRRAAQGLLAAAAVVAIGFGVTQVVGGGDPSGAPDSGTQAEDNDPEAGDAPVQEAPQPSSAPIPSDSDSELGKLLDLALPSAPTSPRGCRGVPGRVGDLYAVTRLDNGLSVVRFRRTASEDPWVATVFPCGDDSVLDPLTPSRTVTP